MTGFMRDQLGDYQWAIVLLAILNGVGATLFLIARKPKIGLPQSAPAPVAASATAGDC